MSEMRLPLNLQFFAEGSAGGGSSAAGDDPGTGATADGSGTQAGENSAGTGDGTTQGGADPAEGKEGSGEKEAKEAGKAGGSDPGDVRKLVQEEMKKAAMSPEERAKYEADEREKSLKEREEAVSLRERTAEAKALLAENGLPASFVGMVVGEDEEKTKENVKAFKSQFDAAVQAQVEKRMGGRTPEAGSGVSGAGSGDAMMEEILRCF